MTKLAKATSSDPKLVFENFLPCRFKAIAERSVRLLADTHETLGITAREFDIMVVLSERINVSSRDINQTNGMDKATITRALDRLIEKALIVRTKSKKDSRLVNIKLTSKGRRVFSKVEKNALLWESEFLRGINLSQLNKLYHSLEKIDENLDKLERTKSL
ncbi:MAG: hypothetical protein CMO98_05225 [Woeseia sp.]|nr:hypothetical protein [Woeseia sp.]